MKEIINNKKGMTLLEMIVAISIFLVVAILSSNIFVSILKGQRNSIAQQNTQENMRYVFEVIGKEIRQAQRSDDTCFSTGEYRVYNTNAAKNILYFKNKAGDCVSYALVDDYLVVRRGARVASTTPSFLKISGLFFEVTDNRISYVDGTARVQPKVTLKMKAEMNSPVFDNISLDMQTTISSRYYE